MLIWLSEHERTVKELKDTIKNLKEELKSVEEIKNGTLIGFVSDSFRYRIVQVMDEYFFFKVYRDGTQTNYGRYSSKGETKDQLFEKIKQEYHKVLEVL